MFNDDLAKFVDLERVIKDRNTSSANLYSPEEVPDAQDSAEADSSPLADAA